jgi:hypothetical protein
MDILERSVGSGWERLIPRKTPARSYDEAVYKYRGDGARLNFPRQEENSNRPGLSTSTISSRPSLSDPEPGLARSAGALVFPQKSFIHLNLCRDQS